MAERSQCRRSRRCGYHDRYATGHADNSAKTTSCTRSKDLSRENHDSRNTMTVKPKNSSTLGQEFFYGISRQKNYRKAFPYLLDAAANGYVHAQNLVGYC